MSIIIIKKKRHGHGGHHGGAWKVAYADFVTAMMALFIVLWLLSSSEQVQKAVGGYFQDPSGAGKMMGTDKAGAGDSISVNQDNMHELKAKLSEEISKLPDFKEMKDQVKLSVTGEGLRIELLEKDGGMFFELGNQRPTGKGRELLVMLAKELALLPNRVAIEGHTDAKPYATENGYSNWELSADRANAARRVMQESGLRIDQVAYVRGFADQELLKPQEPFDASNRRISVIVRYQEARPHSGKTTVVAHVEPEKETAPPKDGASAERAPPQSEAKVAHSENSPGQPQKQENQSGGSHGGGH